MTDLHSCSYFCNRPECIKAQRDELRERLAQQKALTDDEIALIVADCSASAHRRDDFSFARAIEAAIRARGATKQQEETNT